MNRTAIGNHRWRPGSFSSPSDCQSLALEACELMRELYPICRSITGDGVRATLKRLGGVVPLALTEVPSGTPVLDWEIPREWNVRQAWIKDASGRKVVDFAEHNLHLMNYSMPYRGTMTLDELQAHLHSLPDRPDWIPYRTTYYRDDWGFCLRHRDRLRLQPGKYEILVDSELKSGSLTYAEHRQSGSSDRDVLVYTHTCHPSLANDNLTGMAVAALLARELGTRSTRYSYRFVFGPGTIGSLAWLAANEAHLDRIEHGLVLCLLGDKGALTYKESRQGGAAIDRVCRYQLPKVSNRARLMAFEPYGYDERQFCSPGFDLPVGRLTRSPNSAYAEYHTSADNLEFVDAASLAESIFAAFTIIDILEANRTCRNLLPKGEPRLGRRGLYGNVGGKHPVQREHALLWVLSQSDGSRDLLSIADRSGIAFPVVAEAADTLEEAGLVGTVP